MSRLSRADGRRFGVDATHPERYDRYVREHVVPKVV